jgi:hypothetical protein
VQLVEEQAVEEGVVFLAPGAQLTGRGVAPCKGSRERAVGAQDLY